MVHDGVQKGVLWSEEALHHRHLGLYGWNAARSYWIPILSTENLEERESFTVRLTVPQCSDAGSYSFCQSPPHPPLPPPKLPAVHSHEVQIYSVSEEGAALSVQCLSLSCTCSLPPRTRLPRSLLSLHSNACTIPLSLFIYQQSLSLSPPFSLCRSIHPPYIVSTF